MNEDRNAEIIRRRDEGEPFVAIARSLGITKSAAIGVYHRRFKTRYERVVARGEKVAGAKLTEKDVYEIRRLRSEGEKLMVLGALYGVHFSTISMICRRRSWAHIGDDA